MNLNSTKEEFEKLEYKRPTSKFNGFVIIPTGEIHDSGYVCMKFALTNKDEVVGCVGGGSDVINLNGIGGYGKYDDEYQIKVITRKGPIIDWSIDCLPCGLLRVFTSNFELELPNYVLSSFEIFIKEVKDGD